jgi:hypothetical protein
MQSWVETTLVSRAGRLGGRPRQCQRSLFDEYPEVFHPAGFGAETISQGSRYERPSIVSGVFVLSPQNQSTGEFNSKVA